MEPKVTICITTWNRAHLIIDRSLYSALHQDYDDYEILVIDHGSTDNTEEVVKSYQDKRIRYHKMPVNTGCVTEARNLGAKLAKGKYIVFLDDDNMLYPQYLKETINVLDLSGNNIKAIGTGRMIKYKNYEDYASPYKLNGIFISLDWGWLIKKEVFDHLKYDKEVFAYEDVDFGIQFTNLFRFSTINKPLQVAFDDGGDSHSYPTPKHLIAMEKFLEKHLETYKKYPNELRFLYRSYGRRYYMAGYRLKGINYFWKSFLAKPSFSSFKHFFAILFGWYVYDLYMDSQERSAAKKRLKENKIS